MTELCPSIALVEGRVRKKKMSSVLTSMYVGMYEVDIF